MILQGQSSVTGAAERPMSAVWEASVGVIAGTVGDRGATRPLTWACAVPLEKQHMAKNDKTSALDIDTADRRWDIFS